LSIEITRQTGGNLIKIITEDQYSFDYNIDSKEVRNEQIKELKGVSTL
jgi:hypothetical protein